MKKDNNGIPLAIEVPVNYSINENGHYILETDTMYDTFLDKVKSLDSLCVKVKQSQEGK